MASVTLTKEGLEKLHQELQKLKSVDRPAVIERIRKAKEFGDLSENAEYEDAKNQQSFVEGRVQELESMIRRANVISSQRDKSKVNIGDKVTIKYDGENSTYQIVGTNESDPVAGKISSESPIALALLGHKVGDSIGIPTPDGKMDCTILKIE